MSFYGAMPNGWNQAPMGSSAQIPNNSTSKRLLLFIPAYPNMAPPGPEFTFVPLHKLPPYLRSMPTPPYNPQLFEEMTNTWQPVQQARCAKSSPTCLGNTKEMLVKKESNSGTFPPISKSSSTTVSNTGDARPNCQGLRRIDIERHNSIYNTQRSTEDRAFGPTKDRVELTEASNVPKLALKAQPSARIVELAKPRVRTVEECVKSYTLPKSAPKVPSSARIDELAKPKEVKVKETTKSQNKSKESTKLQKSASKSKANVQEGARKERKKKDVAPKV